MLAGLRRGLKRQGAVARGASTVNPGGLSARLPWQRFARAVNEAGVSRERGMLICVLTLSDFVFLSGGNNEMFAWETAAGRSQDGGSSAGNWPDG